MRDAARQIDEYFPRALLARFGGTLPEATTAAGDAVERFIAVLLRLDQGVLTRPVAPGKWTPLGYTEHMTRVTDIWSHDIASVMTGGAPERHPKGAVDAEGNLLVTVPGAEPCTGDGRPAAELVAELRSATERLGELARNAEQSGFGAAVVHVNPYFGELTPLGCMQLAATHAHHHRKRHLAGLSSG